MRKSTRLADARPAMPSNGLGVSSLELNPVSQPIRGPGFIYFAGGNRQHRFLGLVPVRWFGIPDALVQIDEHDKSGPRRPFVPIG